MKAAQFFQKLEAKRQTRVGLAVSIAVEAALAYIIGSLAIDSGSLIDYVLTALLILLLVQDMVAFIVKGSPQKSADGTKDQPQRKGKNRG